MTLLLLIVALLNGTAQFGEESSVTSADPAPEVSRSVMWPCGDDLCVLIVDQAGVHLLP